MDKFLLAENPMAGGNTLAIVHMVEPIAIILVIIGHVEHDRPYRHYTYNHPNGLEEAYTLVVWHLFTTDIGIPDEQAEALISKLLRRAWHWYMAYIKWEDNNIDIDEYGKHN